MNKKLKKGINLFLIATMLGVMATGCKPDDATSSGSAGSNSSGGESSISGASGEEEILYSFKDVKDSSELPDWTGEKRSITIWYAHGTGSSFSREYPQVNLVNEEIERVTGISIDIENSFDNDGQDFNTKLGMIAASNDWPDLIVEGGIRNQQDDLIVGDKVWELSSYIEQYLPDLFDIYPMDTVGSWWDKEGLTNADGKIYTIATALNPIYLDDFVEDTDPERYARIQPPSDTIGGNGYIWVRDDILKMIYPEAKTQQEIEDIFMANGGTFTRDDLFDVTISSRDDLYKLLKGIKDLNITENGRPLEPFFCLSGEDNWAIMAFLNGYLNGGGDCNSYFTYWDNIDKSVKFMYEQDWFKENLKFFNTLQREGLASKEALVDNKSIFDTKLNNGQYVTSYAWLTPDKAALQAAGVEYQYRKVFITVPWNDRFVMFKGNPSSHYNINIVKDAVKEEELSQILRWIGFNISEAGSKLHQWGPKSAGLWEEDADGNRVFTDKELEDEIIYGVANNRQKQLGIGNLLFPGLPAFTNGSNLCSPLYMYKEVNLTSSQADIYFRSGLVDPPKYTLGVAAEVWNFTGTVPGVEQFWNARPGFESLLTKCIAAESDEQFEKLYADMIDYAQTNGMTAETLEEVNKVYRESVNDTYMDLLE